MKTVFVILHFRTSDETIACVESLLKEIQNSDSAIVLVDNFSNNGSCEIIENRYATHPLISLIKLPKNVGFARGNNAGFQYAKEILKADFIVLLNNDTELNQLDFISKLIMHYQNDPFDVLGPDIVTLEGKHQNPKAKTGFTLQALEQKIKLTQINLFLNRWHIYPLLIAWDRIKSHQHQDASKPQASKKLPDYQIPQTGVVLHGSCLIFSPDYISRFNGLYSKTFLYCEEEIIWSIAQQEGLRLHYAPELQILHKEDRSTRSVHQSTTRRRTFKLRHELDSLKELQKIMLDPKTYRSDLMEKLSTDGGPYVSN